METFWLDVRLAARKLARRPAFSLSVALLIAIGVGAGSTVFTLVHDLLVEPPAGIAEPGRIVRLNPGDDGGIGASTYPDYEHYRDNARAFSELFAYDAATTVQLRNASTLTDADAGFVTGNFFAGLGVRPRAGRLLNRADDSEQAENAAVISMTLEQRLFAGTRPPLGESITINGHAFTIVGVAPAEFRGAAHNDPPIDLWLPMWKRPLVTGRPRLDMVRTPGYIHAYLTTMGRLAPGVSLERAQANVSTIGEQVARFYTDGSSPRVQLSAQFGLGPGQRDLIVTLSKLLGGLALILLLIVCANLSNLMLARALAARSDLSVKLALGASRLQLIREYVLDSAVLGAVGGSLGLLFAAWGARALTAVLPFRLARAPSIDLRVFAFALAVTGAAALLCGVLPSVFTMRRTRVQTSSTRVTGGGAAARTALIITQVALCFLLLSGATLFLRTLRRVHDVSLGFRPKNAVALTFDLRAHGYDDQTAPAAYDRLLQRLGSLPGVQSAALGSVVPLSGGRRISSMQIEGRPELPDQRLRIENNVVSPGYFQTLGIKLLRGRDFTTADVAKAPTVVVINQSFARTYFPGQDPVGKRIGRDGQWWEIVGLVADSRTTSVTEAPVPMFYRAFAQAYFPRMQIYLRSNGDVHNLLPAARRAVADVDPNIVARSADALEDVYARGIRSFTVNARLVALLGALALILAAVGLYAVTAYLVTQRTKELGLRMAIGAQSLDILRDVMGGTVQHVVAGLVIGGLATISLLPAAERFLFELSPLDPVTFAVAGGVLTVAAIMASALPARRALRLDPLVALRSEG